MSGLIRHFEDARAIARGAGQKAAPSAVTGVAPGRKTRFERQLLNEERHALAGEARLREGIAAMKPPKRRPLVDVGSDEQSRTALTGQ